MGMLPYVWVSVCTVTTIPKELHRLNKFPRNGPQVFRCHESIDKWFLGTDVIITIRALIGR
jgi:hypothetical protein